MNPSYALGWVLAIWLTTIGALIAYRVVSGQISLDGVFTIDGDRFSPERLQLFIVFVAAIVTFASKGISEGRMPEIPDNLLLLFGASHAVYLGGKVARK